MTAAERSQEGLSSMLMIAGSHSIKKNPEFYADVTLA